MKDLSPQTRHLIERASGADDPDAEAAHRIERSLSRRLAVGTGIAAGSATVAKVASGASLPVLGAKSMAAVLVVGAVVVSGHELLTSAELASRAPEAQQNSESLESGARAVERVVAPPARAPERVLDARESKAPEPSNSGTPSDAARSSAPATAEGAAAPKPANPSAPREPPAGPGATEDALVAETQALRRAQSALRSGDAATAIRLLSEQDDHYRGGALDQERSAARVLALCQAGRVSEARARAEVFAERWPRSPLTGRVSSACSGR
jgi:hypothetical protein